MVREEAGDAVRKVLWADGYVPDKGTICEVAAALSGRLDFAERQVREYNPWRLFHDVMERMLIDAEAEAGRERELTDSTQFTDVMTVRLPLRPSRFETLLAKLYQDFVGEERQPPYDVPPRYGVLVFSYSELYWPTASRYINRIIQESRFEEKQIGTYRNLPAYRSLARLLASSVVDPYVAPKVSAAATLEDFGFVMMPTTRADRE